MSDEKEPEMGYKKLLDQLAAATPADVRQEREEERRKAVVYDELAAIFNDKNLREAVKRYGCTVRFARSKYLDSPCSDEGLNYKWMSINPDGNMYMVIAYQKQSQKSLDAVLSKACLIGIPDVKSKSIFAEVGEDDAVNVVSAVAQYADLSQYGVAESLEAAIKKILEEKTVTREG